MGIEQVIHLTLMQMADSTDQPAIVIAIQVAQLVPISPRPKRLHEIVGIKRVNKESRKPIGNSRAFCLGASHRKIPRLGDRPVQAFVAGEEADIRLRAVTVFANVRWGKRLQIVFEANRVEGLPFVMRPRIGIGIAGIATRTTASRSGPARLASNRIADASSPIVLRWFSIVCMTLLAK